MDVKLKYKKYIGIASWSKDSKIFYGRIIGTRDIISFVANTKPELEKAFQDSIEDYIKFCKETNKIPEVSLLW